MAKKSGNGKKVALGLSLAAAAAGAGYFFFGSKNASHNRKKAVKWSQKLHRETIAKAKKLKKMDEKAWRTVVDESMRAYTKVKSIDKGDLQSAAKELKQNWKHVSAELNRVAKKDTKVVKSVAKKALAKGKKVIAKAKKKTAKKTAKK